jgi:hypothetical protein
MESSSSRQQEAQSSPRPTLEIPEIPPEVVDPAPDELPEAIFIEDPVDSVQSNISESLLGRICSKHNISLDDVLLPSASDRPHNPPEGYTAFYRHACAAAVVFGNRSFTASSQRACTIEQHFCHIYGLPLSPAKT